MSWIIRISIIFFISLNGCKNTEQVHSQKTPNKLINESSPYLLQHAYNPVDWHPWSQETLAKAQKENKILIISIGYAACHWCHVMEHESFEDSTVAAIMNEHFLPIKVDREERPDVDDIYITAANLVTGSAGWPLNAFALPDGRPIWAATYFPKDRWIEILNQFADLKQNNYARLESSAEQLVSGIKSLDEIQVTEPKDYTTEEIQNPAKGLVQQMDPIKGGRKGAPKFPMPNALSYLLKYATMYDDTEAIERVDITLSKMAKGGIYDQVGGGFSRYSVDDRWFAPHFEKMLYDNSQLVSLYSDAYRLSKNELYKNIVERTLLFIERELMNRDGRFYSSLDADSEGEEGKFYIWTADEIDQVITDEPTRELVKDFYNVEQNGNWEHSANILHITDSSEEVAKTHGITSEDLENKMNDVNHLFLAERGKRPRPGLDDKILTSWNALMIKGYIDAFKAFGNHEYLEMAIKSMNGLLANQMQKDARLLRNHKDGTSTINAFLDDYALTIQALLSIYEVTFDEKWLNLSMDLTDYTIAHFYNPEDKLFYYTSDLDPPLVTRKTVLGDDVIPGSNSMMARNLYQLGELYYNEEFIDMSKQMLANIWPSISSSPEPRFFSNWLQLQLDFVNPPYEVAISGKDAITKAHEMMQTYKPNVVFIGALEDSNLPLLKYKYMEGSTKIYVCQNKTCKFPVEEVDKAWDLIK